MNALIHRGQETKYRSEIIAPDNVGTAWNSIINTGADWYRCIPLVQTGTGEHNRIGDQLQPTRLRLDFSLHFANADASTRDITAILYILTSKKDKSYTSNSPGGALASNFQQYLEKGDGSTTFFNGKWEDSKYPIANNNFNLVKKFEIPLLKGSGLPNGSGIVTQVPVDVSGNYRIIDISGGVLAGQDGMATHERSVRVNKTYVFKKLPKFKYSDANSQYPNNFAPVWAVGYYYNDGTAADTTAGMLRVAMTTQMSYKDS